MGVGFNVDATGLGKAGGYVLDGVFPAAGFFAAGFFAVGFFAVGFLTDVGALRSNSSLLERSTWMSSVETSLLRQASQRSEKPTSQTKQTHFQNL